MHLVEDAVEMKRRKRANAAPTLHKGTPKTAVAKNKPSSNNHVVLQPSRDVEEILGRQTFPATLDLRPFSAVVTDHTLVEIAIVLLQRKMRIERLHIAGCDRFSAVGMRSLVHAIGPHLRGLDYSGSIVQKDVLKVLVTRLEDLRDVDFSNCETLSPDILRDFIPCYTHTLEKCNLSHSKLINDEALAWLAGTLGVHGGLTKCGKLVSLNIAQCTLVGDRGLAALGVGCTALEFLNLEGLANITDAGMEALVKGCRALRVLHLKRCVQISDGSVASIGKNCRQLRSINLCGCGRITTTGMTNLVAGATLLQSIDVQGCNLLTEDVLCVVATHLPSLQLLNVNGCQQITDTGLRTLAEHLPYVTLAASFRGLEPRDDATQLKFATHQRTIAHSAALRLQAWFRGHLGRKEAATWRRDKLETPAAKHVKLWFTMRLLMREINRRAGETRTRRQSATKIQALIRGFLVRAREYRAAADAFRLQVGNFAAIKIQTRYRGYYVRHGATMVNQAIHRMHARKAEERLLLCAVKVQRAYRARLSRCRLVEIMHVNALRRQQCHEAALKLQRLYRSRAARAATAALRQALEVHRASLRLKEQVARRLQANWRRHAARRAIQAARDAYKARLACQNAGAVVMQRVVRGWFGRKIAFARRVEWMEQTAAATTIQRKWRHYLAPRASTIIYESLASQIQRQMLQEAAEATAKSEALLQKERRKHAMDSASEVGSDNDDDDWFEYLDPNGQLVWFSPSREPRFLVRPNGFAREKTLVGMGVKMYWPFEETWFSGRVTKFCITKRKHKIEYDDGDKEWTRLDEMEPSHVQVFNGNCWLMYDNFMPSRRALQASLYVNVRFQKYDAALFVWRQGKIKWFDDALGAFCVAYDDEETSGGGGASLEMVDLFACEDDVQVQDRRSLQWMGLGSYFFGLGYAIPPRLQDYLDYEGPYEQDTWTPQEDASGWGEYQAPDAAVEYGEWMQNQTYGEEDSIAAAGGYEIPPATEHEFTWTAESDVNDPQEEEDNANDGDDQEDGRDDEYEDGDADDEEENEEET
ncbi:hypothetical protein LEN26_008468 [Aphanomyces euteiches]|nr:hypothetical protein LEN26_008468 [Aphanomyces euteiches]